VSNDGKRRVVWFPGGVYRFSRLYGHYDAALNPGFSQTRYGAISLVGVGRPSELDGASGGTVLSSTVTTGTTIALGTVAANSRDIIIKDLAIKGATSGYLVEALHAINIDIEGVEFIQGHAVGSALRLSNGFFGRVSRCRFSNSIAGTGTAIVAELTGAWTYSGLFKVSDNTNISTGFAYGLRFASGGWQIAKVEHSEVIGSSAGIYVNAGATVDQLVIDAAYFEGATTSFIAEATGDQRIKNLRIDSAFLHGAGLTGPAIDLYMPNSVTVDSVNAADQDKTFLNIFTIPSGGFGSYTVRGINFPRSGAAPAPVSLFTGILPVFIGKPDYATGDANVSLYGAGKHPVIATMNSEQGYRMLSPDSLFMNPYTGEDTTLSLGFNGAKKWALYDDAALNNFGVYDWTAAAMRLRIYAGTGLTEVTKGLRVVGDALFPPKTDLTAQSAGIYYGTAAPASGTFTIGSRVLNSTPAVGQPKGWICTVSGTPGTWVSEGNL
jgi:hypothetical protein